MAVKSDEAAKATSALITDSMGKAALGVCIAEETAASFAHQIMTGINESVVMIKDIANVSVKQNQTITSIKNSTDQLSDIVQRNSTV